MVVERPYYHAASIFSVLGQKTVGVHVQSCLPATLMAAVGGLSGYGWILWCATLIQDTGDFGEAPVLDKGAWNKFSVDWRIVVLCHHGDCISLTLVTNKNKEKPTNKQSQSQPQSQSQSQSQPDNQPQPTNHSQQPTNKFSEPSG